MRRQRGGRGDVSATGYGDRVGGSYGSRPGATTPPGMVGQALARGTLRVPSAGPTQPARSFPGQGGEGSPYELSDATRRNVRVRADPKTGLRVQRGQDWDPRMPALRLGLPWRPAPDSAPVRRADG